MAPETCSAVSESSLVHVKRISSARPRSSRLLASSWLAPLLLVLCCSRLPRNQAASSEGLPRITACLMARGELTYLTEWIEFHYLQGEQGAGVVGGRGRWCTCMVT